MSKTRIKTAPRAAVKQTKQETMRAAALDGFGGPEMITLHTIPVPEVGPDEVLIRVESAGVGVWDAYEREGGFAGMSGSEPKFPYVLGSDGAGTVAAVGENVRRFRAGDRVYAFGLANPKGGFYAEYTAIREDNVSLIPGNVPTDQAGALPWDAMTALRGLDDTLGLQPGESLLIFGASGGIGHLAVQLAQRMGVRVFAVASGDDGVALARHLGADAVVDGHRDDIVTAARAFAPEGFDAALITAGGEKAEEALTALGEGGRVAYPNGVEPEPQARSGVIIRSYDGTPDPQANREAQPADRGRPVRGAHRPHLPAGPGRRGPPGPRHPLPRQARSAAQMKGNSDHGAMRDVARGAHRKETSCRNLTRGHLLARRRSRPSLRHRLDVGVLQNPAVGCQKRAIVEPCRRHNDLIDRIAVKLARQSGGPESDFGSEFQ